MASRDIYFNLAAVYATLGQNSEALEAYRYGRILDPESTEPYEEMAAVYQAAGDPEGEVTSLHEKALLEGYLPPTVGALVTLYGATPDASCALTLQSEGVTVDFRCDRVRREICRAVRDLAQAFEDSRMPARRIELEKTASERFGCAAAPAAGSVR